MKGHVIEVASLKEGYSLLLPRGGLFNGEGICHVREVASLMEGEWSCYGGGQFKEERIIVTEVASFKEGEWSLQRWSF